MKDKEVKQYIKQLNDLSTTPVLLGKILSLVDDDKKSIEDLSEIISYDQAMAQRVLRTANSTFFAHSGQIRDIPQAVMFLGLDRIKSIAVGMTVMNIFPTDTSFHVENLWIHGYEVAYLSSILSGIITVTQPQECFLGGLLHDIGRIILYTMAPDRFIKIETTDSMLEQETGLFGCTHAEAGAWFAEEVHLPTSIVSTIRFHHHPSAATEEQGMVAVVSLAEALARMFKPRMEDDGIWTNEQDALLLEFSLSREVLLEVSARFEAAQADIERFFAP